MAGDEETEMLAIRVDKRPISQSAVVGFALVVVTQAFIAGGLYYKFSTLATDAASKADFATLTSKVEGQEQVRTTRSADLDRNIDDIQAQLKPLGTIELRLDQNDKRDDAQDARMDKILEMLGGKLDTLNDTVSGLKADVRVMAADVKSLSAKTSPTSFRTP